LRQGACRQCQVGASRETGERNMNVLPTWSLWHWVGAFYATRRASLSCKRKDGIGLFRACLPSIKIQHILLRPPSPKIESHQRVKSRTDFCKSHISYVPSIWTLTIKRAQAPMPARGWSGSAGRAHGHTQNGSPSKASIKLPARKSFDSRTAHGGTSL
jgi:hypothetical protein